MINRLIPEWSRISDRYFWLTAFIIARNSITREYQSSFLGVVWTVILPLIQVVIYALIMPLIMARKVDDYVLYLIASFPLWAFISASLVQSCNSIINQAETIKRCVVSSVVFPIADIMKQFHTYAVSFFTMYLFCILFVVEFDAIVFWLPIVLLPLFITMLATSIAIAYAAPYVRDIGFAVHMLVTITFWLTPVIYPLDAVPEQYHWLFWLNPFFVLMHPVQQLLFAHSLPTTMEMLAACGVMVAAILFSLFLYRLCRRNYVYYL
jgi:ABC-type polysaccharide/polyol phosphate export permease